MAGKKVKKFAAGGWSTSVSFDEKDAAERAKKWAEDHKKPAAAPVAKKAAPVVAAPKVEAESAPAPRSLAQKRVSSGATVRSVKKASDPYESWSGWKRLAARFGTAGQREKYKAQGYAKGGKVRGDGCATKGKTKGSMR
jgi:hypothetical protein